MKKIFTFGIIFFSSFAASTAATTFITRGIEVATYNQSEGSQNGDYSAQTLELSDNEKFINALSSMGNLNANLSLSLSYESFNIYATGYVKISMEKIEDLCLSADLSIDINEKHVDLLVSYYEGLLYLDIENTHLKLGVNNLGDVVTVFNNLDISFDLPEEIKNMSTLEVINRLSNMKIIKQSKQIKYELSIFDNTSPIVFTSDLNYNLTSVQTRNFSIAGLNASLFATVNVLGNTVNNYVENPENKNTYVDGSGYFGMLGKIQQILETKKASSNCEINIFRSGDNIFSLDGEINFDFANSLLSASGNILVNNQASTVNLYYTGEAGYLNYDNHLKVGYSKTKFEDLIKIFTNYKDKAPLSFLLEEISSVDMPIISLIKEKNYTSLLTYFDKAEFSKNKIELNISNGLFGDNNTNIVISLNGASGDFDSIEISNLVLEEYVFDIKLNLKDYEEIILPDLSKYEMLDNFDSIFEEVMVLCEQRRFAVDLSGNIVIDGKKTSFSGDTQFDLDTKNGSGLIDIVDNKGNNHHVQIDVHENDEMFFVYNNTMKGYFNLDTVRELIDLFKGFIESDDPRFSQYSSMLAESILSDTINKAKEGKYEALINSGIVDDIHFVGEDLYLTIPGKLIGGTSPLYVNIDMEDAKLSSISLSGNVSSSTQIDIKLTLQNYNDNWQYLDISNREAYTDYSEIKTLVECVFKTAELDYFDITGSLKLTAVSILNWNLPLTCKIKINEDERVQAYIEIKDIPILGSLLWGSRNSKIYVDQDDVYIYAQSSGTLLHNETVDIRVTAEEFKKNILYYLCNVILGLSESTTGLFPTSGNDNVDYARVLNSYGYNPSPVPTWDISLNMQELTGSSSMNNLSATIKANSDKYMNSVAAKMSIGSSIFSLDINLNASLINIGSSINFDFFNNYVASRINKAYSYH